jgi:outer membrane protein assembly factor BamE (lipoprotein component of BamABCDE complex)
MSMTLRPLCLLLVALFLAVTVGGCTKGPVRHLASDVCMVKPGQTSRQEVLELMGEPDSKRMVAASMEQWVYYEEDKSSLQAAPLVGGTFDPNGYHMVMITLAGDTVSICRYSAYDQDEFAWQDDYSWQEIKK